jgi:hypothetical protein
MEIAVSTPWSSREKIIEKEKKEKVTNSHKLLEQGLCYFT